MEIRRVFVDKLKLKNGMALLSGQNHKYIAVVLRKCAGDRIDLIDGKGYLYRCIINNVKNTETYLQVLDVMHRPEEKRPKVTLCISPIKGQRMDWVIEKATELNVDRILPAIFKRTVIKVENKEKKTERWKKLAIEASRQSGRFTVPEIIEPMPLKGILPYIEHIQNKWVFYEKEKNNHIREIISTYNEGEICMVIGPEGGIDVIELEWLKGNGFVSCSLGENIFRAETTPLVILSIMSYEFSKR